MVEIATETSWRGKCV